MARQIPRSLLPSFSLPMVIVSISRLLLFAADAKIFITGLAMHSAIVSINTRSPQYLSFPRVKLTLL
jgi:hypothetical protein